MEDRTGQNQQSGRPDYQRNDFLPVYMAELLMCVVWIAIMICVQWGRRVCSGRQGLGHQLP